MSVITYYIYIIDNTTISTTVLKMLGERLMCITKDKTITKVYYSPDIVENVIAITHLQLSGHEMI